MKFSSSNSVCSCSILHVVVRCFEDTSVSGDCNLKFFSKHFFLVKRRLVSNFINKMRLLFKAHERYTKSMQTKRLRISSSTQTSKHSNCCFFSLSPVIAIKFRVQHIVIIICKLVQHEHEVKGSQDFFFFLRGWVGGNTSNSCDAICKAERQSIIMQNCIPIPIFTLFPKFSSLSSSGQS